VETGHGARLHVSFSRGASNAALQSLKQGPYESYSPWKYVLRFARSSQLTSLAFDPMLGVFHRPRRIHAGSRGKRILTNWARCHSTLSHIGSPPKHGIIIDRTLIKANEGIP